MHGLDIVRMVVSARASHSFGLDVVGHNFVVIAKRLVTDCAFSALVSDFPV
jgi:hypothetical protein